jgi:pimeloyl-ACP methyl ester carboxylesterase
MATYGPYETAQAPETGFAEARTARVGDTALSYVERGEGDPVVFVHGSLSDLRTWEQQLPAIARSYRCVAYSRRYARPNADIPPGSDDQMIPHVDDLVAFLRAVHAPPAHLIGNSWGAFICLLAAIRHPGAVRTLVLEEPPVVPLVLGVGVRLQPGVLLRNLARRPGTTLPVLRFGARTITPVQRAFRRGEDNAAMQLFLQGVLGPEGFGWLPEKRERQARENLSALKAQMLGAGLPPLSDDDVRSARVPVRLLTGEHSPPALQGLTDRLGELLPDAERVEIPAASHAMHEQNASAVNAAILSFLERHRQGASA